MAQRQSLHDILLEIMGSGKVYFQPPANLQMEYPCIVYRRDNARSQFAGNQPYHVSKRYLVTYITRDPDSDVWEKIAGLPLCLHNRYYAVNNLNHDVFNLYFEGEISD